MNVLTNNGNFCNTGMIAARGTEDAEESLRLIEIRLKDYGMKLKKDIICSVFDGGQRLLQGEKLLKKHCLHHISITLTYHLGLCDVIYVNKNSTQNIESSESNDDSEVETDEEPGFEVKVEGRENQDLSTNYKELINKVRKIMKKI